MSKRKGNQKKQGQKYQNTVAFSATKWGTNEKLNKIASAPIGAVCTRCADKLEWRKKYNKYKPLRVPASCEYCKKKTVKHAYHKACLPCAEAKGVCAMCKTKGDVVDLPTSRVEELREQQQREAELRHMKERVRRTYLRKLQREEEAAGGGPSTDRDGSATESAEGDPADEGGGMVDSGDPADGLEPLPPAAAAGAAAAHGDDDLNWEAGMSDEEDEP
mmetsp:Transcript_25067/g.65361  ORF Transcript_25067/g.65361 Transcript_25067/m.65361 type:complete len:218 (+) Transcript_25067:182-835(+)